MTDVLVNEYEEMMTKLGPEAGDDRIVAELVAEHDWTRPGARTILTLAQSYGTAILRNALALANAMRIEDGESGL